MLSLVEIFAKGQKFCHTGKKPKYSRVPNKRAALLFRIFLLFLRERQRGPFPFEIKKMITILVFLGTKL